LNSNMSSFFEEANDSSWKRRSLRVQRQAPKIQDEELFDDFMSSEESDYSQKKKSTRGKSKSKRKEDNDEDYHASVSMESFQPSERKRKRSPKKLTKPALKKLLAFDKDHVLALATQFPDQNDETSEGAVQFINKQHPLKHTKTLAHPGAIYAMQFSTDYTMLATVSNLGTIRIWDTDDWSQIAELRDTNEPNIEEFFCLCWSKDNQHILAAGRLKSREKWSEVDDDNEILPCPIKIFDVFTGSVVAQLKGHREEVLAISRVEFKGQNYLVSASEDGKIIKWKMNEHFSDALDWIILDDDDSTSSAVSVCFVPNCGNKYLVAGCDDGVKLFDFEHDRLVETWKELYSYLCDCVKFVNCKDMELDDGEQYLLTKGVELVSDEGNEVLYPNKCILHKLIMPDTSNDKWSLEEVGRFEHDEFYANLWLTKFATNGRYIVAPTSVGKIFIWNLQTNNLVGVLKNHEAEVREIVFHPFKPLLLSCGDESKINIYEQSTKEEDIDVDIENDDEGTNNNNQKKKVTNVVLVSINR